MLHSTRFQELVLGVMGAANFTAVHNVGFKAEFIAHLVLSHTVKQ